MAVFFALVALVWLAALAAALAVERDPQQRLDAQPLSRGSGPATLPAVEVVIPARDEESNIGPLLESLLVQEHPPAGIMVVDDQSTDGTAAIVEGFCARDARIRCVRGDGPPAGWRGKPAALVRGFAQTSAPWVLFVDADVRLSPANLRAALSEAQRRGWSGISLWGRWVVPSAAARWLQTCVGGFVRGMHPLDRINDPQKPEAFLNGQYLLIEREAYLTLGGWESVKERVLEDVAFARLAKAKGVRIGLLRAPELLSVEPYRTLREVWGGYLKNFVEGAGGDGRALLAGAVIFAGAVLPFLFVAVSLMRSGTGILPDHGFQAALGAAVAALLFGAGTARVFHHPRADALMHPLGNALFVVLILHAVLLHRLGRQSSWKGRSG